MKHFFLYFLALFSVTLHSQKPLEYYDDQDVTYFDTELSGPNTPYHANWGDILRHVWVESVYTYVLYETNTVLRKQVSDLRPELTYITDQYGNRYNYVDGYISEGNPDGPFNHTSYYESLIGKNKKFFYLLVFEGLSPGANHINIYASGALNDILDVDIINPPPFEFEPETFKRTGLNKERIINILNRSDDQLEGLYQICYDYYGDDTCLDSAIIKNSEGTYDVIILENEVTESYLDPYRGEFLNYLNYNNGGTDGYIYYDEDSDSILWDKNGWRLDEDMNLITDTYRFTSISSNIIESVRINNSVSFIQPEWSEINTSDMANKITFTKIRGAALANATKEDDEKISESEGSSSSTEGWTGNGSGMFLSANGYFVTNYHVIDGASLIQVEWRDSSGQLNTYSASVERTDEANDLAICKIENSSFNLKKEIPYTFKNTGVMLGEEVFALGYPLALSVMGEDIKFSDGRVSSKTGFQGDIRTYQTTVAIQPGNSGGPLFDFDGNLIGINSSKINNEYADNVSYSIKSSYLTGLIDLLPDYISFSDTNTLKNQSFTNRIEILKEFVLLVKTK